MNLLIDYIKKKKGNNNMKCDIYGKSIINLDINNEVLKDKNIILSDNIIKFFKTNNQNYIKKNLVVLPSEDKDFNKLYKNEMEVKNSVDISSLNCILQKEDIEIYRDLYIINEGIALYYLLKKLNFIFEEETTKKLDRVLNIYSSKIENNEEFKKTVGSIK